MNIFFKMKGAYKRSAMIADTNNSEYDEYDAFLDFTILSDPKMKFEISKGKKPFDIIQLRYDGFNFLISENVKNILDENMVSGWKSHPAAVKGLDKAYYSFHTTGKAGEILNKEEHLHPYPPPIQFDIDTWDGSDIFNLKDTANIICTERVKDLLEHAKITNLEFSDL